MDHTHTRILDDPVQAGGDADALDIIRQQPFQLTDVMRGKDTPCCFQSVAHPQMHRTVAKYGRRGC